MAAIALMDGTLKAMMITRWVLRCAAVLVAFVTLGAGVVVGDSPRTGDAGQAKSHGLVVIAVDTVDSNGKPLSGVDLGLAVFYSGGPEPKIERATSDNQGRGRLQVALNRSGERASYGYIWAYHPGRALANAGFPIAENTPPPPVHLVLDEPVKRTITVVGPDDRPIEGLRLLPYSLARSAAFLHVSMPEEWRERLTVTTDHKGIATVSYLSRAMRPLAVQLSGPGLSRHTLEIEEQKGDDNYLLKLGRTGRLVGIVRTESGEPLAGIPVEVWVRASGTKPIGVGMPRARRRANRTEIIRFDSNSPRTGPQGAFQTPPTLLDGSTYRVSIRHAGFAPFVSDWMTLDGDRTAVPTIRLRALRKLAGLVRDRQGQPVAQARVFLPSRGPSTATDAQGRFELSGIEPEKTIVLVQRPGFRLQGWPVDPAMRADDLSLTLVRTSEEPERVIAALADPLPASELKALAGRLLEPYLLAVMERDTDIAKLLPLLSLTEFDPGRVREILDKGQIKDPRTVATLRGELALQLAAHDATDAKAEVAAISEPQLRAHFLVRLAAALPAAEPAPRRSLLEEAIVQARAMPESPNKLPITIDR